MANITIVDTGYGNVESTGTRYSTSATDPVEVANAGSPIELKGVSISYDRNNNVDSSEGPDNNIESEVNQVSTKTPKIVITGIVTRGSGDYSGGNMSQIALLDSCSYTKGIKCVYYNDSVSGDTGYPLITKFLGKTDSFTQHPSEKHFHVRFNQFSVTQSSNNKVYRFNLTGEVTK